MKLRLFNLTASGDKEVNEDFMAHIIDNDFALFVVADGLGGHMSGDKASRYFTEGFIEQAPNFTGKINDNPEAVFDDWFNAAVIEMANKFGDDETAANAHTTCAILFINNDLVVTLHCGDSRIYRMEPKEILWRSKDHSKMQNLIDLGKISEDEIRTMPEQHQITRSVTVNIRKKPEIKVYPPVRVGETFVLCSDGFWGHTKESEFLQLAQSATDKKALIRQMQMVYYRANGSSDNITVQMIKIDRLKTLNPKRYVFTDRFFSSKSQID